MRYLEHNFWIFPDEKYVCAYPSLFMLNALKLQKCVKNYYGLCILLWNRNMKKTRLKRLSVSKAAQIGVLFTYIICLCLIFYFDLYQKNLKLMDNFLIQKTIPTSIWYFKSDKERPKSRSTTTKIETNKKSRALKAAVHAQP